MSNLWDLVQQSPQSHDDDCIYAQRPWTRETNAMLVRMDDGGFPERSPPHGYEYFLEISICRELQEDTAHQELSPEAWFDLILKYAETDA